MDACQLKPCLRHPYKLRHTPVIVLGPNRSRSGCDASLYQHWPKQELEYATHGGIFPLDVTPDRRIDLPIGPIPAKIHFIPRNSTLARPFPRGQASQVLLPRMSGTDANLVLTLGYGDKFARPEEASRLVRLG
jgi:hypothetical protein